MESMTIEFDVTPQDLEAFTLYMMKEKQELAQQRMKKNRWRWLLVLWGVMFGIVIALLVADYLSPTRETELLVRGIIIGIFGTFAFLLLFVTRFIGIRGARRMVRKTYEGGRNVGVFEQHRMTLTPEAVIESSQHREVRIEWPAVERIVTTDDHLFIYVNAAAAFVIGRRAFASEQAFWDFVRTTRQYRGSDQQDAGTLPPPAAGFDVLQREGSVKSQI